MTMRLRNGACAAVMVLCLVVPVAAGSRAATPATDPQQSFFEALSLIDTGEYEAAIARLRGILHENPDLHRVRLELARAYFLAKRWELARREFFTVLSADIPPEVRENILVFLRAIDARRGWNWGFDAAIVSGEGATRDYRSDTVTLVVGGQPLEFDIVRPDAPDFGIAFSGYVEMREALQENDDADAQITGGIRASLRGEEYEGQDFDEYQLRLDAPITVSFPERSLQLGPFGSYRIYGGDPEELAFGIAAEFIDRSVDLWTFAVGGSVAHVDSLDDATRDGIRFTAGIGALRSLGGRAIAGVTTGVERMEASQNCESYTEWETGLILSADLGIGVTGTFRPAYSVQHFDGASPLFPAARSDREAGFSIQFTKTDLTVMTLNPYAGYEFSWHDSTVELYRYTDHVVLFGLTKSF